MVTPNGRTMTTTSISADRNMAILLVLVFNGKIYPEKGIVRKIALCPISKHHIFLKEGKAVMRLRNVGEEKIAIYCPQGSGTLRQQLLIMH